MMITMLVAVGKVHSMWNSLVFSLCAKQFNTSTAVRKQVSDCRYAHAESFHRLC